MLSEEHVKESPKDASKEAVPLEEALNLAEIGKYNYALLAACNLVILASSLDIFSLSVIVPASACDLNLSVSQQGIISAMPFLGIVLSSHFWGYLADTKGRRLSLLWSLSGTFIFGMLSSFSPNLATMAVLRFASSCSGAGTYCSVYTLIGECNPARIRSRFMLLMSCSLMMSMAITAIIAYPLLPLDLHNQIAFLNINYRPWRLLTQILSLPAGVGVLFIFMVYESPKFLASQDKIDEALDVLSSIYSINTGKSKEFFPVKTILFEEEKSKEVENILHSLWQQTVPLFKPPLLKRTLQLYYVSIVTNFTSSSILMWVPYVVNSYILGNQRENNSEASSDFCTVLEKAIAMQNYSNNTIGLTTQLEPVCEDRLEDSTMLTMIAMDIAASLLNLVVSFVPSKKASSMSILILCGVCYILTNLSQNFIANLVFFLTCQTAGVATCILIAFYVELYPTNIRGMAASLGNMFGRMFSFLGVTVIGLTIKEHCTATIYVWGALISSAALVLYFLPKESKTTVNNCPT